MENDYTQNRVPQNKRVLKKMLSEGDDEVVGLSTLFDITNVEESDSLVLLVKLPRRSGRIFKNMERYGMVDEANIVITDTYDDDPSTFRKTMESDENELCLKAMKQDMKSMYSNYFGIL